MSIDPHFLAPCRRRVPGVGGYDLQHGIRLVCGRQRGSPALLPVHPLVPVQAVVFIAVSAICLLAFKPLAKRLHKQPTPHQR